MEATTKVDQSVEIPSAPVENPDWAAHHEENLATLLTLAQAQYEAQLQATDSFDNKFGFLLTALGVLLTTVATLPWSQAWDQFLTGGVWLTLLAAFGCCAFGLAPRSYSSANLQTFRKKYTTQPPANFTDQLLTEFTAHIEANTKLNASKARFFALALRLGSFSVLLYALEVATKKHA